MANKSLSQLLADWRKAKTAIEKLTNDMPRIIGNESVKVVKENFKLQGYDSGNGVTPWQPRKAVTDAAYDRGRIRYANGKKSKYRHGPGGYRGSVYNSENKLLLQARVLYNGIKYIVNSKRSVTIGVDDALIPYGRKMNEGGPGKWGKRPTMTPARKFMPTPGEKPNAKILAKIFNKIERERKRILRDFKR
jgi:hypothetical protein